MASSKWSAKWELIRSAWIIHHIMVWCVKPSAPHCRLFTLMPTCTNINTLRYLLIYFSLSTIFSLSLSSAIIKITFTPQAIKKIKNRKNKDRNQTWIYLFLRVVADSQTFRMTETHFLETKDFHMWLRPIHKSWNTHESSSEFSSSNMCWDI